MAQKQPRHLMSDPNYQQQMGGKRAFKSIFAAKRIKSPEPKSDSDISLSSSSDSSQSDKSLFGIETQEYFGEFEQDPPTDVPDLSQYNEPVDVVPNSSPKVEQEPEPDDGKLPDVKCSGEITDEIEEHKEIRKKVSAKPDSQPETQYEEEDYEEDYSMDELEAYEFIKDHPKFFSYEIKYMIVEEYERTCVYRRLAYYPINVDEKIAYIKSYHPDWYETAYEYVIRKMAITR